ncbi:MAG TPA: metal ABC transporter ATP-binding protein [Bryobacteraceae bacterium]|nr:metal ABC transporter ATP-binding protein [Bryobacteraceae bacterium]
MSNVLEVDRLSVRLGKTQVLTDLSFRVEQGTSLAVIGPNGAGKTVLFRALIGSLPFTGAVRWAPQVRIGYVPQKLDIDRDVPITGMDFLMARENLPADAGARLQQILDLVGIPPEVARSPIGTLSGGQFQRLLIGFALLGDPTVLMLDEPTAGIDAPGQKHLNRLVHQLQEKEGLTVLFISHELSVIFRYATNVLCLGHGQSFFGPPRQVLTGETLAGIYGTEWGYHVHEH